MRQHYYLKRVFVLLQDNFHYDSFQQLAERLKHEGINCTIKLAGAIEHKAEEDLEPGQESDQKPGKEPGKEPEQEPGKEPDQESDQKPGKEPEQEPGKKPGQEPEQEPGKKPGQEPEQEPGKKPGKEPGKEPGQVSGMEEGISGCLWITDSLKQAEVLVAGGKPLLAFYHDRAGVRDCDGVRYGMEAPEELEAEYLDRVYRRFAGIPWDILETDRCLLRETTQEDVDSFYHIYHDPSITKYTEDLYPEVEQEKQYVQEYIEKVYSFYEHGVWTVLLTATGEVIGRAGYSYRPGFGEPELGFIIGTPWQRQGIAKEICQAILEYGRTELGFQIVRAMVEPANSASLALCERLGFVTRERRFENGREYLLLYKLLQ